jgi:hypothetical protein
LDDLKALAFSAIRSRISEANIIDEVFSKFTSVYPDIEKMEVAFLCNHFYSAGVKQDFQKAMDNVVRGELPHSARVLVAAFEGAIKCQTAFES